MKEALKLALEALEKCRYRALADKIVDPSITAIKEALAQPEQEPVAWMHWTHGPVQVFLNKDEAMLEIDRLNREYPVDKDARQMKPLYTAAPQRTWVGLTGEDHVALFEKYGHRTGELVGAVEDKLKEKNN